MSPRPAIFVVGAGPQIASAVAALFASHGFAVGLSSRSEENLKRYAALLPPGTKVAMHTADVANPDSCVRALEALKSELGSPSVVLFNAGSLSIGPKPLLDMTISDMEKHMQMNVLSGFAVFQWTAKHVQTNENNKAALYITGGGLSLQKMNVIHGQPRPGMAGLAAGKAALLNLAKAFRAETKGIHIATVIVKGLVDKENPFYFSKEIAKEYWKLYEQSQEDWQFEVEH